MVRGIYSILFFLLCGYAQAQSITLFFNGQPRSGIANVCNDTCITITHSGDPRLGSYQLFFFLYETWLPNPITNFRDARPIWTSGSQTPQICFQNFGLGELYMMIYMVGDTDGDGDYSDTARSFSPMFRVIPCRPGVEIHIPVTGICAGTCITLGTENKNSPAVWSWHAPGAVEPTASGPTAAFCYNQPGNYRLRCIASNSAGNDTDEVDISVYEQPVVHMPPDTVVCSQAGFLIRAETEHADRWLWNTGETVEQLTVYSSGSYTLMASNGFCADTGSVAVQLLDIPQVDLGDDLLICSDESVKLNAAQPLPATYVWSNGSDRPEIWVDSAGVYAVQVTNQCGSAQSEITLEVKDCYCQLFLPDAFTPDGDNLNETFKPVVDCRLEAYRMRIYDRWGGLVFESKDINSGWEGNAGGFQAPTGIYVVKIEYAGKDVKKIIRREKITRVTLLR